MAPNTIDTVATSVVPWTSSAENRHGDSRADVPVRLSASVMLHLKLTRLGLCSNQAAISSGSPQSSAVATNRILRSVGASGSSTVAIDNKIEQAMDLVKSHLMFAVREEVEVLKERIDVLMERIAYLESENQILRAAATQETLAQISQLEVTFANTGNTETNSNSAGSVAAVVNNTTASTTTTTTSTTTSSTPSQVANGTSPPSAQ